MPFPGPSRKRLCGAPAPPPGSGTFLGRGLASSPAPCRGAEARAQGGGTLNGPLCPLTRGLCGQAHGPHTPAPRTTPTWYPGVQAGTVPVAQSRQDCPHKHPLLG